MYVPSDGEEDDIEKWMRQQFAATPMPKPYAAEGDDGDSSGSSSDDCSSSSSEVDYIQQQQQQQPAMMTAVQLHLLEQQQQQQKLHAYQQAPLVLPAAVPIALPEPVRHVGSGLAPYSMQQPLTMPQQQPAVEEDATDEELLALLLSS
jgi:hypothetical protein